MYIDNNRLRIDLIQPNAYASDCLDSEAKLTDFNGHIMPTAANIAFTDKGSIMLSSKTRTAEQEPLAGVTDIIREADGTLYALTNDSAGNTFTVYRKTEGDADWQDLDSRSGAYGYTLCSTERGVLVGVSHLYATADSGLYLLAGNTLCNLRFTGEVIRHVQFIENHNGMIYLYGNYYSNLLSFSIYTLLENTEQGTLAVPAVYKTAFANNFDLRRFILTADSNTAVLCTTGNNVFFYNKTAAGYVKAELPALCAQSVVCGEYSSGAYNAYLLLGAGQQAKIIMETKEYPRKYFHAADADALALPGLLDAPQEAALLGAGFRDDDFVFLYSTGSALIRKAGKLFFKVFYAKEESIREYTSYPAITAQNNSLLIVDEDTLYLKPDSAAGGSLCRFYDKYNNTPGALAFNYINSDIEGLTGFSFEVDPPWLAADTAVTFGFSVKEQSGAAAAPADEVRFAQEEAGLKSLLAIKGNAHFTVTHNYDNLTGRVLVCVEFTELQKDAYLGFSLGLHAVGSASPAIANISVHKKIMPMLCANPGEKVSLPIRGYVYDRTVSEVLINEVVVPLARDGSFFYNYEFITAEKAVALTISCENGAREHTALAFILTIMNSQNGICAVQYATGSTAGDLPASLVVEEPQLTLSGHYFGLTGAAVGYELYSVTQNGADNTPVLVKQGLFETEEDSSLFADFGTSAASLGNGYTAGRFFTQSVELISGKQQLIVFCENPGGVRAEYKSADQYPTITYSMPEAEQEIRFYLDRPLVPQETVEEVPIAYHAVIDAYESAQPPYTFTRAYTLTGEIRSLYNFTDIVVRSFTPGLVFSNGASEILVQVGTGNRFTCEVRVTMDEDAVQDYYIGAIPTVPFLTGLRKGVKLTVKKNLAGACFIPDFSRMEPAQWSAAEKKAREIPFRLGFNRTDVPVPGLCLATLVVNHVYAIQGRLDLLDGNLYCLKDENNAILKLTGNEIKEGVNRIAWTLQYEDPVENNCYIISSSAGGAEGMEDFTFTFHDAAVTAATRVWFESDLGSQYYNSSSLPRLAVSKDPTTALELELNGTIVWADKSTAGGAAALPADFALTATSAIREGKNDLRVLYTERSKAEAECVFTFLYDTQAPAAAIEAYRFSADYTQLLELTAWVTEANFSKGLLLYNGNMVSQVPEVQFRGGQKYLLTWKNLAPYNIFPAANRKVEVDALDLSGKRCPVPLSGITGCGALNRPGESAVKEEALALPLYTGGPQLANERFYTERAFPAHTKFAPQQFLQRASVQAEIEENDRYLGRNWVEQILMAEDRIISNGFGSTVALDGDYALVGEVTDDANGSYSGSAYVFKRDETSGYWMQMQKLTASDGAASDFFGRAVALSGDYALVGACRDDDKGIDSGAVYVFQKESSGTWVQVQKLIAGDGTTQDQFGESVALSGDYMLVGAWQDDDKGKYTGSAYVFQKESNGIWVQVQKLTAADWATDDYFGCSVALAGDYALVGACGDDDKGSYSGSAYVFRKESNSTWVQVQKLTATNGSASDSMGKYIVMSGDYAFIGTALNDPNGNYLGDRVFKFIKDSNGSWIQEVNFYVRNSEYGYFGVGFSLSNNFILVAPHWDYLKVGKLYFVYLRKLPYNTLNATTNLIFPQPFADYLVFKAAKDTLHGLTSADQLPDKIQFEVTGQEQDKETGVITTVEAIPGTLILDQAAYQCINSQDSLYYFVKVSSLKAAFSTALSSLIFDPAKTIVDRGSLRIIYNGITPADVFVQAEGAAGLADNIVYDSQYEDPAFDAAVDTAVGLHPALADKLIPLSQRQFIHGTTDDELSLGFWMRPEDEGLTEEVFAENRKRLFTFTNKEGRELGRLEYRGTSLYFCDTEYGVRETALGEFRENNGNFNRWNLVTLRIDKKAGAITITLDDQLTVLQGDADAPWFTRDFWDTLLEPEAGFYFGPAADEVYNTGFYSVADAFRIRRLLSEAEIERLYKITLTDKNYAGVLTFAFSGAAGDFGTGTDKLKVLGGADYHQPYKNCDYAEAAPAGSLKASSFRQNFLKRVPVNNQGNVVILGAADSYMLYNLQLTAGEESFTLTPGTGSGRYYFGDRTRNYGLGKDRWYTVSGRVIAIAEGTEARLVLRINAEEQSLQLAQGRFSFIYENVNMLTPEEVKLYIETNGQVTLGTDLVFNEGNFALDAGLEATATCTTFPFDFQGTIQFRYKPLNTNRDGLCNYAAVLFDSELLTIRTELNAGDACYAAYLKDEGGGIGVSLPTGVKVTTGWHHLQFSYRIADDQADTLCYFYIDGKLAAYHESFAFKKYGSLTGNVPALDNLYLGCSMDKGLYAEGYFDNVVIGKYYLGPQYTAKQPVQIAYNAENLQVTCTARDPITTAQMDAQSYVLEALDGTWQIQGTTFPVDLTSVQAGRYRLTVHMLINAFNYEEVLCFNIDSKPRFSPVAHTPLIFSGVATPVSFSFFYDKSHQYETRQLTYAGIAGRITYAEKPAGTIRYLVQDFIEQDTAKWLLGTMDGTTLTWTPVKPVNNGLVEIPWGNVTTTSDITCAFIPFYFEGMFPEGKTFTDFGPLQPTLDCTVPLAAIREAEPKKDGDGYEYKLHIEITDTKAQGDAGLPDEITITYITRYTVDGQSRTGNAALNSSGKKDGTLDLFYDDILPENLYGAFTCTLRLMYAGVMYAEAKDIPLAREKKVLDVAPAAVTELEIEEFSLLYLDKETNKASVYLTYLYRHSQTILTSSIQVFAPGELAPFFTREQSHPPVGEVNAVLFKDLAVPQGKAVIRITLYNGQFTRSREMEIANRANAPAIVLTNTVDAFISYNNVYLSWIGYYNGQFNAQIQYQYDFDGQGWSTPSSEWRNVRFYSLEEGYHTLKVRSLYAGVYSDVRAITFFVDIYRPEFCREKIKLIKKYDEDGVFNRVIIQGVAGAITDASLKSVTVNGTRISSQADGSFITGEIPITVDGVQEIRITAHDKVGNFTDYPVQVENRITTLRFPDNRLPVRYSPLTIAGQIAGTVTAGLELYLCDPLCTQAGEGNYMGWKKAVLNGDRTFFIENVYVNPGTREKEILTPLTLACVFASGAAFVRTINVWANEIFMPLDMRLSMHAAEGERSETTIRIQCTANVKNISSWSIDFNGDGVYDSIELIDNPQLPAAQQHTWEHTYSCLGRVNPRVRIITADGNFFSVSDTVIIHEKIKEASNKLIAEPQALTSCRLADGSLRLFALKAVGNEQLVEVYKIGKNDESLSNRLFSINLTAMDIRHAGVMRAADARHLYVAAYEEGIGKLYALAENDFGNFEVRSVVALGENTVSSFTLEQNRILVSFMEQSAFTVIPLVDGLPDGDNLESVFPAIEHALPLGARVGLANDGAETLVADYYYQRIVRLTPALKASEQFGSFGNGEGAFLKPTLLAAKDNRILVYDAGRHDIQVFDAVFKPVCTLGFSLDPGCENYVESTFFDDIAGIEIMTRTGNNLLYYYAAILSRSAHKLALIRLPQWEELRARVRNNMIVFSKDGEIFTAKPDGSDLKKILSSDSIPRIDGTLDYPALSPDGRQLAFTSHTRLYNGAPGSVAEGNEYDYNNLYYINIETQELVKIDTGILTGYNIERPVFNSNGDRLIFSAKPEGGKWQIYVYEQSTGCITQLFTSEENARFPYYSPDDRFVVFTTDYDGDSEIEIIDTENTTMRITVTSNNSRDSLPVWSTVYPHEIADEKLRIESKIAFVSERNYHKGVYCVYLRRNSEADIRVFNLKTREEAGNQPDAAAMEITGAGLEGDYPCFTGDGKTLLFEYYNGSNYLIKQCDFEINQDVLRTGNGAIVYQDVKVLEGAMRPAGMKNMIANFKAENRNGDEIALSWERYTDNDIFYRVQFKVNAEGESFVEKKLSSQTSTLLKGLDMNTEYLVRVLIVENDEEVCTSQWVKVKLPETAARPGFSIDPGNPYLVKLTAWKPRPETNWKFSWIIDNTEINVQQSTEYLYEFGTSGTKTIFLKATNADVTATSVSAPMTVNIISDIKPVLEHTLAADASYIELSALASAGQKIDFASALWIISGPGREPLQLTGAKVIAPLNEFRHKINVHLRLSRIPVNGQNATDTIQENRTIGFELTEVIPIITPEPDAVNARLIRFTGEHSTGNIDWYSSGWSIFADGEVIYAKEGVSTIQYLFPETNNKIAYTVTLTVRRKNDGITETVSQAVCVEALPIEPRIEYEILELKEQGNVVGARLLLDCTKSLGSNIDFSQARWNVPVAGMYNETPTQFGPVAVYNLPGIDTNVVLEVALNLCRKNGTDSLTTTKSISIKAGAAGKAELIVKRNTEKSGMGTVMVLDVLSSTGPDINWERTEWLINGQYKHTGPVVRYDVAASGETTVVPYVCSLYRYGVPRPEVKIESVEIGKTSLDPIVITRKLASAAGAVYEMSVLDTKGVNIDWERTDWYIYDGSEAVVQRRGAVVTHSFVTRAEIMGYPVLVEMYFKGSSYPFVKYTTLDVAADELRPWFTAFESGESQNILTFNATGSKGSNIDWSQAKWTFGDSSEAQYGAVAVHVFPVSVTGAKYRVTLTLTRNNGTEAKSYYEDVSIGADKITAAFRVEKNGNFLVFDATTSEGKGILLERAVWLFEGEGDTESLDIHTEGGTIQRNTFSAEASISWGWAIARVGISDTFTLDYVNYDDYTNQNQSFSSSNQHTGPVCRRTAKPGEKGIRVTLFVYRMKANGEVEGESVTSYVNYQEIGGGKVYGK